MSESLEASTLIVLDLMDRLARQQYQDGELDVYTRASGVIRQRLEEIITEDNPGLPAPTPAPAITTTSTGA